MVDNEVILTELIKLSNNLSAFQLQTAKSFEEVFRRFDENDKRWEENDKRWEENDKRWEENDKRWEQNERRWEENERRWEENNKRWKENDKRWEINEENRKNDKKELMDVILRYDISISTKLRDPNAQKMKKVLKI